MRIYKREFREGARVNAGRVSTMATPPAVSAAARPGTASAACCTAGPSAARPAAAPAFVRPRSSGPAGCHTTAEAATLHTEHRW